MPVLVHVIGEYKKNIPGFYSYQLAKYMYNIYSENDEHKFWKM